MKNFYRSALCIVVVFSLETLDSFYNVNKWIEEIQNNNSEDSILVLIGNKCDLTQPRVVPRELTFMNIKNPFILKIFFIYFY